MEVLAWPSWSAAAREDRPAWSMRGAKVLRKAWDVTHSKPAPAKASRRSAWVLEGSRQLPSGAGKTGRSARSAPDATSCSLRWRSIWVHPGGTLQVGGVDRTLAGESGQMQLTNRRVIGSSPIGGA